LRLFFDTSSGLTTGAVEALDAVGGEQVAVGDETGDCAVAADAANELVELGVQQGLAAADGDNRGTETAEVVDALEHDFGVNRAGGVVVFVTVGASEIAAADGDDVRHDGVAGVSGAPGEHSDLAQPALQRRPVPPRAETMVRHEGYLY
jgi:hypothetical protein